MFTPALPQMVAWEEKTQIGGFVIICNANGFNLKQFRSMTWTDLKYICMLIQDYFPLKYNEIHVANTPKVAYYAYQMMKPMMGQNLRDKIHFHTTLESLHQKVDKSVLTEDLGGSLGPPDCQPVLQAALQFAKSDRFQQVKNFIYPE